MRLRYGWLLILIASCGLGYDPSGPLTLDDTASTTSDRPIDVAVLVNDRVPPGESLTVTSARVVAGPGVAQVGSAETVRYVPEPGTSATVEIHYDASTGAGDSAVGRLFVDVVNPELIVDLLDGPDFGVVYLGGTGKLRVGVRATAGSFPLEVEAPGLGLELPCDVVSADSSCELIVTWTPTESGPVETSLRVNNSVLAITGAADHALALEPSLVSGSITEGQIGRLSARLVNRAPFNVGVEYQDPRDDRMARTGTCRGIIDARASCDYEIRVSATGTAAGEQITGAATVSYASGRFAIELPIEVSVTQADLAAPQALFPPSGHGLWSELIFEGFEVGWNGDGGPAGPKVDAEVCIADEQDPACVPIGSILGLADGELTNTATLFVKDREAFIAELTALVRSPVTKRRVNVPILRWRVSATSLGGGAAPSGWVTYEVRAQPVQILEFAAFPEPDPELPPIINPESGIPEVIVEVVYELNVFEPLELRLLPIADIGDGRSAPASDFTTSTAILNADSGRATLTATRDVCGQFKVSALDLSVVRSDQTGESSTLPIPVYRASTLYYWLGITCIR